MIRSKVASNSQLRCFQNLLQRGAQYATKAEEYNLIAQEQGLSRIEGYTAEGFTVNSTDVQGAVLCLSNLVLHWNVRNLSEVTVDSLAVLDVIKPKPDIVVIGCGENIQRLPDALTRGLAAKGIAVEVASTPNAIATFNVLNEEGRVTAGALLPLRSQHTS
ncbi:hypothetical protein CVIRNUC_007468 [Coccomyxa viridis]|uniref:NADH dehydrogenase [ubiquinone] 1 alpha subcomplex assembly factor 3 n=1 Tax=Coccomyxa viridis TaxID=1274662 RepID=A0AAV1IE36_9CHLO|nr:hypothetical protein CVIRNUC_007468 [Coccomyxa viridis]